eukprot:COSAG01_NODE_48682_length_379_cov_0.557143_1_plen_84_part_01
MRVWDLEHGAMERELDVEVGEGEPVSCCYLFEGKDGRTKLLAFAGVSFAVFDLDSGKCEQATNEDEMESFAPGFEDPARGCTVF